MRRLFLSLVLLSAGTIMAACSDSTSPTSRAVPGGISGDIVAPPRATVIADLNAIFPTGGIGTAANAQLTNIFRSLDAGNLKPARQQAAALCQFTQNQAAAGRLQAPAGVTLANAVTNLCNELYLTVGLAPGGIDVSGLDATAQFVPACTAAHVKLPNGHAVVDWPARNTANECTYDQDVTLIITPIDYSAFPVGHGPLLTTESQWAYFYDIAPSPLVQPHNPVVIGICTIDDGSAYVPPEEIHGTLRIGHNKSAAVGGGFELLPPAPMPADMTCPPTGVIGFNLRQSLHDGGLLGAGRDAAQFLASSAAELVTPTSAYAAHGGLGGLTSSFSPFGAVSHVPSPVSLSMQSGSAAQLVAPFGTSSWASSDPTFVPVSGTGVVSQNGTGAATIVAKNVGGLPLQTWPVNVPVFMNFPRTTIAAWNLPASFAAASYRVIVEYCGTGSSDPNTCSTWTQQYNQITTATQFQFDFVGMQAGRWHVEYLDANNNVLATGALQTFVYGI